MNYCMNITTTALSHLGLVSGTFDELGIKYVLTGNRLLFYIMTIFIPSALIYYRYTFDSGSSTNIGVPTGLLSIRMAESVVRKTEEHHRIYFETFLL